MNAFLAGLLKAWKAVRSNPVFVLVSSSAFGAVVSAVQDELSMGHIDLTRAGLNKLVNLAVMAAIAALVHLYRPQPNTPPPPQP